MINYFNYNGYDTRDMGIIIKSHNAYDRPERDIEFVPVPGRNGSLIVDNERYNNIAITYNCRLFSPDVPAEIKNKNVNMSYTIRELSQHFMFDGNYYILTDSYNPDYYRHATCVSGIPFELLKLRDIIDFAIQFNCKPQLYRWDGQKLFEVDFNTPVYNPENTVAKPYFKIYPSENANTVVLGVESETLAINNISGKPYIEYDCETQNASYNGQNLNKYATGKISGLKPGKHYITAVSGIAKVEIKGRWYMI